MNGKGLTNKAKHAVWEECAAAVNEVGQREKLQSLSQAWTHI